MSMHIEGDWLTTTSTKKRKPVKYKSAEAKRQAEQLAAEWDKLNKKYTPKKQLKSSTKWSYELSTPVGRETAKVNSNKNGMMGVAAAKPTQQYTGTQMLGVTVLHKSCLQPVFDSSAAVDAAHMRR